MIRYVKDNLLMIETSVYQAINGGLYMNYGCGSIVLPEECAQTLAYEIPDFDPTAFNTFYKS
jgi:hypothetical protein